MTVVWSSDSFSSVNPKLEISTPDELIFAASAIGMWPPPRIANGVLWFLRICTASLSWALVVGSKTQAGPSQALEV